MVTTCDFEDVEGEIVSGAGMVGTEVGKLEVEGVSAGVAMFEVESESGDAQVESEVTGRDSLRVGGFEVETAALSVGVATRTGSTIVSNVSASLKESEGVESTMNIPIRKISRDENAHLCASSVCLTLRRPQFQT